MVSKHKRKIRRKKTKVMTEVLEICDGVTDDWVEQELLDCFFFFYKCIKKIAGALGLCGP